MQKFDATNLQAQVDNRNLTLSEKPRSPTIGEYGDDERRLVNWFFASMRTQWGVAKYNSQFGEAQDVDFAKRHWAPRIVKFTAEQLKDMLQQADSQRIAGNQALAWPDPAAILSLVSNAWERRAHKEFKPLVALENLTAKEARLEAGRRAFDEIRALGLAAKPPRKPAEFDARAAAEDAAWINYCNGMSEHMDGKEFNDMREAALRENWR